MVHNSGGSTNFKVAHVLLLMDGLIEAIEDINTKGDLSALVSIPNTQAASHGAGHNLPVNSGKLLVKWRISRASFHLLFNTKSLKSGIKLPNGHPLWQNGTPQSIHLAAWFFNSVVLGFIVNSL